MNKTYYPKNLVSTISNEELKISFSSIGLELYTAITVSDDIPLTLIFVDSIAAIIKRFYSACGIQDKILALKPNYLTFLNGEHAPVIKETHPFYQLFDIIISERFQEGNNFKHNVSIGVNAKTLATFLYEYVSSSLTSEQFSFLKSAFVYAVKSYVQDKNNYSYKHYKIDTHSTKDLSELSPQNLFYDFNPQYNFYNKQYENLFSTALKRESVIPNYYVAEQYLFTNESDRVKNIVSLGDKIKVTEQSILSNQYFTDYSKAITEMKLPEEINSIKKVRNYVLDSSCVNPANNQLSSENFPYAVNLKFSNYPTDSLLSVVEKGGLSLMLANNSHKKFVEETPTAEMVYVKSERHKKTPSENGDFVDIDGERYIITTTTNFTEENIQIVDYKSIVSFKIPTSDNDDTIVGFETYSLNDLRLYTKHNRKRLSMLKTPLSIFPYITLTNKITEICNSKLDYSVVLNFSPLDVYPICYQIEKKQLSLSAGNLTSITPTPNSSPLVLGSVKNSIVTIARSSDSTECSFVDTQIIYEKEYIYDISTINLINSFTYTFEEVRYSNNELQNLTEFKIVMEGECAFHKNSIFSDNVEVIDNPPTTVDVNIVPYIGSPGTMLFLLNTQDTTTVEHPKLIFQSEKKLFDRIRRKQKLNSRKVMFETISDLKSVQVFRTTTPPTRYNDFQNSLYRIVNFDDATATSFRDGLSQNTKYYYTFRSVDVHNNISNPTEVFEVEIINNDGAVYSIVKLFTMEEKENYVFEKSFKKYLSINPSVLFTQVVKQEDDTIVFGTETGLWEQEFKVRITSKKSGKSFDVNLKFKKRIRELIN